MFYLYQKNNISFIGMIAKLNIGANQCLICLKRGLRLCGFYWVVVFEKATQIALKVLKVVDPWTRVLRKGKSATYSILTNTCGYTYHMHDNGTVHFHDVSSGVSLSLTFTPSSKTSTDRTTQEPAELPHRST